MWGMGVWNGHLRGTVSLACPEYELPSIIADIATDSAGELWNRQRRGEVNKVTCRTPDYMLCSARDYHLGEKACQQHIWQAILGHDAVVLVTHPPSMSENGALRPNSWSGNSVLPRVAQWKDTLVAVHKPPEDDWMGFTHAYYPVHSFDEYVLRDGWAFARRGEGYLALTAAQGIELVHRGSTAFRELRSHVAEHLALPHGSRERGRHL